MHFYIIYDTISVATLNKQQITYERKIDVIKEIADKNLLNMILYSLIATEINKTPLDIRVAFLHSTNKRKNSLNLDISESFKPLIIDRTVFSLINRRAITTAHFDTYDNNAVYLSNEGKEIFISALFDKMHTKFKAEDDTNINYYNILSDNIGLLVRHFKGTGKYKTFRQVR